eukprot:CAMPEP_0172323864 /NCGR_PEP_ID=MMETSP1058-20130122/49782_1 /TAXON_ID=83371 /ORGANISM="Detonula confervacea, Strain CCMP 353" /LENGTH=239 /DNA_ID=CAMNT_0013039973 /DNA_START=43 /DNA_END=762 /DNA_ORIENTATION=-
MSTTAAGGEIINHLIQRGSLTQFYSALRHGQSLANVANIISSDPKISTVQHGLSDVGKDQAKLAGESFAAEYQSSQNNNYQGVAIFSSDFTRARETASIFADALGRSQIPIYSGDIILERRLRERYFGELNGGPDTRYQEVWDVDIKDANHNELGVESANSVLERTTKLITDLDEQLQSTFVSDGSEEGSCWKCILVAHGDVLQIMQTGFLKHDDASRHRSLQHLETATIRELSLASYS